MSDSDVPVLFMSECGALYVDESDQPIERTPQTHPYSYDEYVLWRNNREQPTSTMWSDRMRQWDHVKYQTLWEKHVGKSQYWSVNKQKQIEQFIREYVGKPITICYVLQGCNVSNGYPVWRVAYIENKENENG